MLDPDTHVWSMWQSKANRFRVVGCFSRVATLLGWVGGICTWVHPPIMVLVQVLLTMIVLCQLSSSYKKFDLTLGGQEEVGPIDDYGLVRFSWDRTMMGICLTKSFFGMQEVKALIRQVPTILSYAMLYPFLCHKKVSLLVHHLSTPIISAFEQVYAMIICVDLLQNK